MPRADRCDEVGGGGDLILCGRMDTGAKQKRIEKKSGKWNEFKEEDKAGTLAADLYSFKALHYLTRRSLDKQKNLVSASRRLVH